MWVNQFHENHPPTSSPFKQLGGMVTIPRQMGDLKGPTDGHQKTLSLFLNPFWTNDSNIVYKSLYMDKFNSNPPLIIKSINMDK
jgi:hypothetical protein